MNEKLLRKFACDRYCHVIREAGRTPRRMRGSATADHWRPLLECEALVRDAGDGGHPLFLITRVRPVRCAKARRANVRLQQIVCDRRDHLTWPFDLKDRTKTVELAIS